MRTKHALYAIHRDVRTGETVAFRVGQPTTWGRAQDRFNRLYPVSGPTGRAVKWMRRRYSIDTFEVRSVDRHGRGIGASRHALAFPVPYRACVKA